MGNRRLLHPKSDDIFTHVQETQDGRLLALTERGAFYLKRLRLNRPPLVALRRTRREHETTRNELTVAKHELRLESETIRSLETTIQEVFEQLANLLRNMRN